MKKQYKILLLIFATINCSAVVEQTKKTGQSFIYSRPLHHNIFAKKMFWQEVVHNEDDKNKRFQVIPIFQKSEPYEKLKEYFLLENKSSIVVKGDTAVDNAVATADPTGREVRAEWLGIAQAAAPGNFSCKFSVAPEQTQYGGIAEFNADLKGLMEHSIFDYFYVGIEVPFVYVENNLKPSQSLMQNAAANSPKDVLEALGENTLKYGIMADKTLKKMGIPEVRLSLVSKYTAKNGIKAGTSTTLIVPIEDKPDPKYIFSPSLGNNGHLGLGMDITLDVPLMSEKYLTQINWFVLAESSFFYSNTQKRTLDLYNKPWSRYMQLRKYNEATTSATNVLTLDVNVEPFNVVDVSTGFRIKRGNFEGCFAYGVWAHGYEKLTLEEPFETDYGVAGYTLGATTPAGAAMAAGSDNLFSATTNSTISKLERDYTIPAVGVPAGSPTRDEFVKIKEADLGFTSAAAQNALVHKIQCSLGWSFNKEKSSGFFGLGGSADIPHNNTALANYSFWFKVGLGF